jgi:hypothetical protein
MDELRISVPRFLCPQPYAPMGSLYEVDEEISKVTRQLKQLDIAVEVGDTGTKVSGEVYKELRKLEEIPEPSMPRAKVTGRAEEWEERKLKKEELHEAIKNEVERKKGKMDRLEEIKGRWRKEWLNKLEVREVEGWILRDEKNYDEKLVRMYF